MKAAYLSILFMINSIIVFPQPKPSVSFGRIDRIEMYQSKFVTSRHIDIWLPEGYSETKKHAVLYMHDGQMLYDANGTWNKQSWEMDEVANSLIKNKQLGSFIIVGIWNDGENRHADYFPQKPFESLTIDQKSFISNILIEKGRTKSTFKPQSNNYLKFITEELKPYIDKNYAVKNDRKHTFIAGSSMGGLISMYALCEYPKVFGGAACLSTHWPGIFSVENNPIPLAFNDYLKRKLKYLRKSKLYFDYGNQTLDALYPPLQKEVDKTLQAQNKASKYKWGTYFFEGKDHSENAWKERIHIPLLFLLSQ
ncbi:MAG: hypothetical protein KA206_03410 [Paludibacter sp.]|nr:hypothetical protein [Paludibacter sp.]